MAEGHISFKKKLEDFKSNLMPGEPSLRDRALQKGDGGDGGMASPTGVSVAITALDQYSCLESADSDHEIIRKRKIEDFEAGSCQRKAEGMPGRVSRCVGALQGGGDGGDGGMASPTSVSVATTTLNQYSCLESADSDHEIIRKRKFEDPLEMSSEICMRKVEQGDSLRVGALQGAKRQRICSSNRLQTEKRQRRMKDDDSVVSEQQRTYDVQALSEAVVAPKPSSATRIPSPLHALGIDLIMEILGWLSGEDLVRACLSSMYLRAIGNMPSFRHHLRIQHSSKQAGPFLGIVMQKGGQIYLRSPNLRMPLKRAAMSLADFLATQSSRHKFMLRDSRDGRFLVSSGKQFLVWSPFEEDYYNYLPICPALEKDEELICAAFLPHNATRDYTVIAVAVKASDRSIACLKKFVSKGDEWSCSQAQCPFKLPERSKLQTVATLCNGHMNILSPSVGIISINILSLMMRIIPLPLQPSLGSVPRRHQIICRNRGGSLCLVTARVIPDTPGRGKKTFLSVSVFDWTSQQWTLTHEWPVPKNIPCSNLVGFAEGHGTVIVGTGWDALYMMNIDDGSFSHEMRDTGASSEVLTYEVEYPSTSWWDFTKQI